jgi:predicted permease
VSDGYFKTFGIPLLRGRAFGPEDTINGRTVVIIDQAFAQRAWPAGDALGKQIQLGGSQGKLATVVGIAPTLKLYGYSTEPKLAQAYFSARQSPRDDYIVLVRAARDAASLTTAVRRAVAEVDPDQPVWDVRTFEDRINTTFATPRLYTFLLAVFAGLALLLAAVGLYGVLAYQVSRRTREFGIRLALGAMNRQIVGLVLRRGLKLLAVGAAIGIAGALTLGRVLGTMLYRTSAFDPLVFGSVTAMLAAIALLACFLPARRAARVDPMTALRAE